MITLKNVNKYFFRHKKNEIHVINDTSLEFADKGLVALLGPSGCGKTTLLNAIGGLDKINSGSIYIDGERMPKIGNYRKDRMRVLNIGYIFQDYNLLDHLSVFDNVALSLKMIGFKNKSLIKERVDYILELVGMYRYRNKPAGMLSGGQRQRVGIARALVKNPEVIIADEPTGNLDSKNTIEIMNIIKAISKEKLVILVTHEKELAHFYASRIVNITDGKIVSDVDNVHANELDYRIDNKIYLQDFKNSNKLTNGSSEIRIFSDNNEKLNLDIVIKNGNIYIESKAKNKIEVVNEDSGIEFIDGKYEKIKQDDFEKSDFDLTKLDNSKEKIRYTSIYNVFSMLKTGFKKVAGYTLMKKILLIGFFFSAMFIMYSLSSIFGATDIEDEDFLTAHREYISIENAGNKLEDFRKIEKLDGVSYVIPGDSQINILIKNEKLWQLVDKTFMMSGSIADASLLDDADIIEGMTPKSSSEIVIDKFVIDKTEHDDPTIEWLDVHDYKDYVGMKVIVGDIEYEIVGISDTEDPCIYFLNDRLFSIIDASSDSDKTFSGVGEQPAIVNSYDLYKDRIVLKEGRAPSNDYEVIVNRNYKDFLSLNDVLDLKIGEQKLKVVGFYTSTDENNYYLVNSNTYKTNVILSHSNMLIVAKDKNAAIKSLQDDGYNAKDNYAVLKEKYINDIREDIIGDLILSGILLAISFIEIFLMIRASFMSRIKEIGIYRAIGVKKTDIYKMFLGEILIITTIGGVPGAALMCSVLNEVTKISFFSGQYVMDARVIIVGIILIYLLNIVVGLLPISTTIRKTPAEILSRNDVD